MNKKFYLLGLCVAASAALTNAQQLPNVGFEEWKGFCGSSEAFGYSDGMRQRPGDEPTGWNGSSVNQNVIMTVEKILVSKTSGYDDNGSAVLMENVFVSPDFLPTLGDEAPGYITFGTPWVYAVTNLSACDGGTYGGMSFSNRPDAIQGYFRTTDTNDEKSHIIVYLWNGTFKSKVGEKNNPIEERDNVDRAVLGKTNAGEITGDGQLVASCDLEFKATSEWEKKTVELEYVENAGEPTMMNVIISAGNYWDRDALSVGTALEADDVDFVYYSTLTALEVNDEPVALVDGKYEYAMSGTELPTAEQVKATTKGKFAEAAVTVDSENAQVRIVVTNQGGKDTDGETSHTYTLQYEQPAAGKQYTGFLNIVMNDLNIGDPDQSATIVITETGEGTCTFALPNFSLGTSSFGDIVVENVTVTEADGVRTYAGSVAGMSLAGGAIGADVELSGTIDANDKCDFTINVSWNKLSGQSYGPIPIYVTFTSEKVAAGVEGISGESVAVYGMAGAVAVSGYNGAVDVYSVDGRLVESVSVDGNAEIALNGGLYIVRVGGKAYKVLVK